MVGVLVDHLLVSEEDEDQRGRDVGAGQVAGQLQDGGQTRGVVVAAGAAGHAVDVVVHRDGQRRGAGLDRRQVARDATAGQGDVLEDGGVSEAGQTFESVVQGRVFGLGAALAEATPANF
jgi:hypothetical protein